jgi:brefeldin A-inhibited guanine nucleotide-exchange protein
MKDIECIKMLLDIAYSDGDSFTVADWSLVVDSISKLDKVQQEVIILDKSQSDRNRHIVSMQEEVSSQQLTLGVDRIFSSSHNLGQESIVGLVTALCKRSWDEIITSPENPRMYCLQRLVEIGHYNMKRIRVQWNGIWQIVGPHIEQILTYHNPSVSYFALDKLRQLATKFLEIDELDNFSFQKDFLHPFTCGFEVSEKIADMSLTCLLNMVQTKASRLKSGWRAILKACLLGSKDFNEKNVALSFSIVKTISHGCVLNVYQNHTLADYCNVLVSFCKNDNPKISLQAVDYLKSAFDIVQEYQIVPAENSKGSLQTLDKPLMVLPILTAMQKVVMVSELEVRTKYY